MSHKLFPGDIFNIADIALDVARRDPERIAVIQPDGRNPDNTRKYIRHTYRELSDDVESVAVGLREIGVVEMTRTVFMAPPSYESAVVTLALTRVGATSVWIDPTVGYRNVAERLCRLKVEAFVGISLAHLGRFAFGWGPRFMSKAIVVGDRGFPGAHSVASLHRGVPSTITRAVLTPDDPASIMYTTGSTGPAKPTLYRNKEFCNVFRMVHHTWRFAEIEGVPVDMPVFPAFFAVGLSAGGTIVIPPINFLREKPAKVRARALLEVIRDCGVQTLFASPVILENLSRLGRDEGATAPSLHTVVGGGAPLYAHVIGPLQAMLGPGGSVHADYGATEALPVSEMPCKEALEETYGATARGAGLCVGHPFPGVTIKIIGIDDRPIATLGDARELPLGEVGEIIARGPHISQSYANDVASTKKNKIAGPDGEVWHRLGDAGYLDGKGRVWCAGRMGHRIAIQSGALFPLMCEPIFDAHPAVRRSGLVGVTVSVDSDVTVPVICVELKDHKAHDGRQLDALRTELLAMAATHPNTRNIRQLIFNARLPVDPRHNSKIERPALARWAARHLPREERKRAVHELRLAAQNEPR
jgi:acyl-coenzyme A synthetase/AMP-(fatty) acid ligase